MLMLNNKKTKAKTFKDFTAVKTAEADSFASLVLRWRRKAARYFKIKSTLIP